MSRNLVKPYFPIPPSEYSSTYLNEVIRAFSVYLDQQQNPGEGRNTSLVLTNLQNNDFGLEPGALFEVEGFVKITKTNIPHVVGTSGTGGVGSVAVTIS